METDHNYALFRRISIESNSSCNRYCPFCVRTQYRRKNAKMPLYLIYKVLDELVEIDFQGLIAFHFYNEPFTDVRMYALFDECRRRCLRNYITTNGDFLTRDNVDILSQFNIAEINVSLYDWQTDDDFKTLRAKTEDRLKLSNYNWRYKYIKGGFNYGTRAGNVGDLRDQAIVPLVSGCSRIENKLEIRYDGIAVMCCQDYHAVHAIGDINKDHIWDIWYGELHRKQIEILRRGQRKNISLCSRCSDFLSAVDTNGDSELT